MGMQLFEGVNRLVSMNIENVGRLIYVLRGQRVMLDYDLASIYETDSRQLKRQVRRNLERFPKDFMLTLTREEYESLRCQIGTLKKRGLHSKYSPFAFTEQGVAMLSGVLSRPRAIEANIAIMRTFVRLRSALIASKELADRVYKIERTQDSHEKELGEHAADIHEVFGATKNAIRFWRRVSASSRTAMTDLPVPGPPSTTKTCRLSRSVSDRTWCRMTRKASSCSSRKVNAPFVALEHVAHPADELVRRLPLAVLEEEEDVVLGLAGDQPLEVGLELRVVAGEEELGLGEEGLVARVLQRLGGAPVEIEEVGGWMDADAGRGDVLVEAEDHALILPRLQARVLLDGAAADGGGRAKGEGVSLPHAVRKGPVPAEIGGGGRVGINIATAVAKLDRWAGLQLGNGCCLIKNCSYILVGYLEIAGLAKGTISGVQSSGREDYELRQIFDFTGQHQSAYTRGSSARGGRGQHGSGAALLACGPGNSEASG